jgi:hypothetical protein
MAISKENKEFIDSLIDYYISESQSYRQIAENYVPEIKSVSCILDFYKHIKTSNKPPD